jgi:hypothetical protein
MLAPNSENLLLYVNIDFPDIVPNVETVKPNFDRVVSATNGNKNENGKKKKKPKLTFKPESLHFADD